MNMEKEIQILNIDDILPNRFQPRIQFNDKNINELADSIKEHGVIQPIVVRKVSDKYEIIAGERRYKASILAGKTTIPAIVTDLDDKNSAEIALIENVQRQDLTPIEEAVSYKKILDMGYLTQSELADKLGKTQSTIANKLRLLNLDDEVQEALLDGKISERHARSLLKLDKKHQIIMLNKILEERLTVRKTDEEIDKMIKNINKPNIESEGNHMDEKIINEFNIPNNPIIEEPASPIVNPINVVTPEPVVKDEDINPGFMDIDKIEENAEDIFKEEQPADLDMLLENPDVPVVEPVNPMAAMQPIVEESNMEDSTPKGGRFFNMFGITQEEDVNPNYVGDLESKETNMDFGIPTGSAPAFNPFFTNIEENQTDNSINNVDNINNVSNEVEASNDLINEHQNSFINPITNMESTNSLDLSNSTEQPELSNNIGLSNENKTSSENNQTTEDIFTPFQPFSLNDDTQFSRETNSSNIDGENVQLVDDFDENELFESPVASIGTNSNEVDSSSLVSQPNIQQTTIEPVTPIYEDFEEPSTMTATSSNSMKQATIDTATPIYEEIDDKTSVPNITESVQVSPSAPTTSMNAEFRTVINTIRECARTIEKYGFKIDTEEIDFEDSYQVTFKIDKK